MGPFAPHFMPLVLRTGSGKQLRQWGGEWFRRHNLNPAHVQMKFRTLTRHFGDPVPNRPRPGSGHRCHRNESGTLPLLNWKQSCFLLGAMFNPETLRDRVVCFYLQFLGTLPHDLLWKLCVIHRNISVLKENLELGYYTY